MSNHWLSVSLLSDRKLDERLRELAHEERGITAELLAHLAEVDARRLCGGMAEGTTFNYCVRVLGFSEDEACKRIRVARTAREYPVIYDLVARGELGLTAVSRLAPLLTRENHGDLLQAARGKTIRELEHLIAERFPKPDAPTIVRKLPGSAAARCENGGTQLAIGAASRGSGSEGEARRAADDRSGESLGGEQQMLLGRAINDGAATVRSAGAGAHHESDGSNRGLTLTSLKTDAPGDSSADGRMSTTPQLARGPSGVEIPAVPPYTPVRRGDRGSVAPLSPDRYRVQLTVSGATREKLLRAQQLMRRTQPDGDLAVVVDRALSLLVDELERRKFGKCKRRPKAVERAGGGADVTVQAAGDARAEASADAETDQAMVRPPSVTSCAASSRGVPAVENHHSRERSGGDVGRDAVGDGDQHELRGEAPEPGGPPEPAWLVGSKRMNERERAGRRERSRNVPRALRRAVDQRDGGRCTFVGPDGRRCEERGFLDFHHRVNFAWGGETTLANLTLHCPAHNGHLAIRDFGDAALRQASKRKAKRGNPPEGQREP